MRFHYTGKSLQEGTKDENAFYHEFINNNTLSSGIYVLHAGQDDPQEPHKYDELYFILEGSSRFAVAGEQFDVQAGDALFVPAHVSHRFFDITKDLRILVFFSKGNDPSSYH